MEKKSATKEKFQRSINAYKANETRKIAVAKTKAEKDAIIKEYQDKISACIREMEALFEARSRSAKKAWETRRSMSSNTKKSMKRRNICTVSNN